MTELQSGGGDPGLEEEWSVESQPSEDINELFTVLAKALRAYQLYDDNNPVRHRFVEGLRTAFKTLWSEVDRVKLSVSEDRILSGSTPVYTSDSRNDSLAFLFYKDGVREIAFTPGIEGEEMERFLSVLQRARKLRPEGDDLLTILWEEDLDHFEYRFVDLLAEGVAMPESGSGHSAEELRAVMKGELAEDGEAEEGTESGEAAREPPRPTVSKDDFNPTLYSLDRNEMQLLREELHKELTRDLRMDVLAALFDRLEEPRDPERQSEILGILKTLLPNFLSRGALVAATHVLHQVRKLEATEGVFDDQRRKESGEILDEVSRPEFITELIQALYDGTIRSTPTQLATLLQFLRPTALAPLLRASETVDHRELAEVLRQATRGIAERHRGAVVRLLEETDPVVASAAARMAGELGVAEAAPALAGLLAHPDPDVRLAAVEAAVALRASTAASALQNTLEDPERSVRIAAARALGQLRYRPAKRRFEDLIDGKEIRDADISEKVAVFEGYAQVSGESAVPILDKLLNRKGFLGKREPTEIRAAAALALGRIEGAAAVEALRKAQGEDDAVVRSAVNRAMRNDGEEN